MAATVKPTAHHESMAWLIMAECIFHVVCVCLYSDNRAVRETAAADVRLSGTRRAARRPSEALLLSGNVTGSEPASCICILAAECRSDCLDPYACSC